MDSPEIKRCNVRLPVPIGSPVYIPYKTRDIDGNIDQGIERTYLSGYVKEGDREFYLTYAEGFGAGDFAPDELFATQEEAEAALAEIKDPPGVRRCRVCGCTDDYACPGGCYWVEEDLCSKCMDKAKADRTGPKGGYANE